MILPIINTIDARYKDLKQHKSLVFLIGWRLPLGEPSHGLKVIFVLVVDVLLGLLPHLPHLEVFPAGAEHHQHQGN